MPLNELFELLWELLKKANSLTEFVKWTGNALLDSYMHFCFSGFSGLLAYCLTMRFTRWALGSLVFRSRSATSWQGVLELDTWNLAICSGLLASWLAHLWWDGLLF